MILGLNLLDEFVEIFVPEFTSAFLARLLPGRDDLLLNDAECLIFRDRSIRHAAHAVLEDLCVVVFCKIAIVRKVLVVIVRNETEKRLLEVRARDRHAGNESCADGGSKYNAELCGRHGSCDCPKHLAALLRVAPIRNSRITHGAGIEVLVILEDEFECRKIVVHSEEIIPELITSRTPCPHLRESRACEQPQYDRSRQ